MKATITYWMECERDILENGVATYVCVIENCKRFRSAFTAYGIFHLMVSVQVGYPFYIITQFNDIRQGERERERERQTLKEHNI